MTLVQSTKIVNFSVVLRNLPCSDGAVFGLVEAFHLFQLAVVSFAAGRTVADDGLVDSVVPFPVRVPTLDPLLRLG